MAFVLPAIPAIVEGLGAAALWAWRGYRVYRAAQTLEAIATASQEADDAAHAKEKEKTAAQTKADAAASADCKNCNEDPDCETAREKVKEALYGIKDGGADNRGLAERLCHWLRGSDEALRQSHLKAVQQAANRARNAMRWLKGEIPKPVGKTEGARMKKKDKEKLLKDCSVPPDLEQETEDLIKFAGEIGNGTSIVKPIPSASFAAECAKDALTIVKNAFGI